MLMRAPTGQSVEGYATRIVAAWNKTLEAIVEVGHLLVEAKEAHPRTFTTMVETQLPFSIRTAQQLMRIANDKRIAKAIHGSLLPTSWRTLYYLTTLSDSEFERGISDGIICSDMERKDLAPLKQAARRERSGADTVQNGCTLTDLQMLATSGKTYGCIYADPPWRYSNQGTRAATGNHYAGTTDENGIEVQSAAGMSIEDICALPVRQLAAKDAHLHLWTTNGFLFECPRIFDAWGFTFKSSFVWVKPQMGIGNYWRNSHEFLLTAVRGDAKRFNDKSLKSWLECDRGRHSAKPERVRHFIERASPGPYLELFGRQEAEGWDVWGNQIEKTLFSTA